MMGLKTREIIIRTHIQQGRFLWRNNYNDVIEVKYLPEVLEDRVSINYNDVIEDSVFSIMMYLLEVFEDRVGMMM